MDGDALVIKYMNENNFQKAAELLNNTITEKPDDPLGYINFGNLLLHMNDFERAERFFNKAVVLDSKAATAYYGLGNLYFEQEQFQDAQEKYLEAIRLGLKESDVYYMLGMAFKSEDKQLLALPYFLRATELNPSDTESLFQYGLSLAKVNYLKEAKDIFNQINDSDSHYADAQYNLGVIALFYERRKEALNHFEEALASQPNHILAANGKKKTLETLKE